MRLLWDACSANPRTDSGRSGSGSGRTVAARGDMAAVDTATGVAIDQDTGHLAASWTNLNKC